MANRGPGPPGTRVPHLSGILGRQPGQRLLQQAPVDHVVLRDPPAGLGAVHGLRQLRRQQGEQLLLADPPGGQRVVQGAVAPGELQLPGTAARRRCHRMIGAQHRVGQLEQRVRPGVQALIQRLPEPAQPLQDPVARDRAREGPADAGSGPPTGTHGRADPVSGRVCSPEPSRGRVGSTAVSSRNGMSRNTQNEGNGRS